MALTKNQVKRVAKLANLPVSDEEENLYSKQLSEILEYVEQLNKVDIAGVEPTFNVSGQENIMAEDKLGDCTLSQDEALSNTPNKKSGFFKTKGIFND